MRSVHRTCWRAFFSPPCVVDFGTARYCRHAIRITVISPDVSDIYPSSPFLLGVQPEVERIISATHMDNARNADGRLVAMRARATMSESR